MSNVDPNRQNHTLLWRALILIAVATALCLAVLALLDRSGQFDFSVLLGNKLLIPALLIQLLGLGLFVCA